jgi:hypothetical protein
MHFLRQKLEVLEREATYGPFKAINADLRWRQRANTRLDESALKQDRSIGNGISGRITLPRRKTKRIRFIRGDPGHSRRRSFAVRFAYLGCDCAESDDEPLD